MSPQSQILSNFNVLLIRQQKQMSLSTCVQKLFLFHLLLPTSRRLPVRSTRRMREGLLSVLLVYYPRGWGQARALHKWCFYLTHYWHWGLTGPLKYSQLSSRELWDTLKLYVVNKCIQLSWYDQFKVFLTACGEPKFWNCLLGTGSRGANFEQTFSIPCERQPT